MQETIKKFTDSTKFKNLLGGQGESILVGNLSIKPIYRIEEYEWVAETLNSLPKSDVRISKPVRSKLGNYIEDGYGATEYIEGKFTKKRITEKLEYTKKLNELLLNIQKPKKFESWTSPWTKAQKIAWDNKKLSDKYNPEVQTIINPLLAAKRELDLDKQLIHTDLSGNILFNENGPFSIDFSPGFFPKEYAEILLLCDSIAWFNAPIESIDLLKTNKSVKYQLILRAVIFRLLVPYFYSQDSMQDFRSEYENFNGLISMLKNKTPNSA